MGRKHIHLLTLALIVGVAALLRFTGLNWDSGSHLHPDERFLTMVGNAMKIPASFSQYLDPQLSPLNPVNIGFPFFVYGLFPLTLNKIIAVMSGSDTYMLYTLQGRFLSAVIDIVAVVFVYKIVSVLEQYYKLKHASVKYWAAFIYAVSVLPIQLSHFFAVDTFLNTFCLMAIYFILRTLVLHPDKTHPGKIYWYAAVSGLFWGLALSSKITAVFMIPLMAGFAIATYQKSYRWKIILPAAGLWLVIAYFTVRIANPYVFASGNIFDFKISAQYIASLKELKGYEDPKSFFPPMVQWSHTTPVVYSLVNLFMYSYGAIALILSVIGGILVFRGRNYALWVIAMFSLGFFIYQSTQITQPVRYFNIIIPYFAILAAVAVVRMADILKEWKWVFIPLLVWWPAAFISIYIQPHSRIAASSWIYETIPAGSKIATEHWDDALPVSLDGQRVQQLYKITEMPVFGPDTDANKWTRIHEILDDSDYYIMSSNRAWRSIMNAPDKYPVMSRFYRDLFDGKNVRFALVGHFTSFPSYRYMGIPVDFPDTQADETFTVYDHPEVYIFKRNNN